MRRRTPAIAAVLAISLLTLAGCGEDESSSSDEPRAVVTSDAPAESPSATADGTSEADAYARVVMTTNMKDVFSGYEVDGDTVRFTVAPGATLDEAQCQYLRMSNGALRQALGLTVVVDDNGTEKEC